jgi:hypothetical protein
MLFIKEIINALSSFWSQNGARIDIKDYMDYDPYLGRVTENSAAQKTFLTLSVFHYTK